MRSPLEQAAALIGQADALIIAAGAGMGVDSGLPDFRGNEGFWKAYPALARAQLDFTSIASPAAFRATPRLAWGFYGHRLNLYRNTQPHEGFALLKRWSEQMAQGHSVFTSNVDGQFQKAGFDAERIHECHGSIHHLQCLEPCCGAIWSADHFQPEVDQEHCELINTPPVCPRCGSLARPNILMFGDWGWIEARTQAQAEHQAKWLNSARRPVVIEMGAGTAIPSVRLFSQQLIHHHQARLIRINPRESQGTGALDVGLAMGAVEGLSEITNNMGYGHSLIRNVLGNRVA